MGDRISDSSEKLLQRGRGEGQYICHSGEGEYMQLSTYFLQKVSARLWKVTTSHKDQTSP